MLAGTGCSPGWTAGQENELEEAAALCAEQLAEVQKLLEAQPNNLELLQLKCELEAAVLDTKGVLEDMKGTSGATTDESDKRQGITGEHNGRMAQPEPHTEHTSGSMYPDPKESSETTVGPQEYEKEANRNRRPNNYKIHPRSKYAHEEPDFGRLSQMYPNLKRFVHCPKDGAPTIDFKCPQATLELTRTLLLHDFGINWDIPIGQLVPPLTSRVNYIHWLEDLLALSSPPGPVMGLDVGCGANLIYPLLGASLLGWHFVGVDTTDVAITWARKNLDANPQISKLLCVRKVPAEGKILAPAVQMGENFHFSMCNPPFFDSIEQSNLNPNTAFGGTPEEMVYPGGEMAFVMQMVEDSMELKQAIHWYTSMVGKKSTLKAVRHRLLSAGVKAVRTTEFFQGKTSRWAIAWSFAASPDTNSLPLPAPARSKGAPSTVERQLFKEVECGSKSVEDLLACLESVTSAHGCLSARSPGAPHTLLVSLPEAAHDTEGENRDAKRRRVVDGGGSPDPGARQRGPQGPELPVCIRAVQERRGALTLMASVRAGASEADAASFSSMARRVFGDLDLVWQS
eukprot:evm.model.scf_565.7 EVM.evm.TU.scf_565.7   scf_565:35419-42558(+)